MMGKLCNEPAGEVKGTANNEPFGDNHYIAWADRKLFRQFSLYDKLSQLDQRQLNNPFVRVPSKDLQRS